MYQFRINRFITLKLVNNKTIIYINGEDFIQCHYLLLSKNVDEVKNIMLLESIDQLEAQLDKTMEISGGGKLNIPPETEFWAHCSNMQVWAEYGYNTKMLHRNIAFPLLKRLTEAGDPIARRVLKEEIAKRFEGGFEPVVKYLIIEGYMEYFSSEELEIIGENCRTLKTLDLSRWEFKKFPEIVITIKHLEKLVLNFCHLTALPTSISRLSSLQTLSLGYDFLDEIPESIISIPNLNTLLLYNNGLRTIPDSIKNMRHIQHLSLDNNRIQSIPDSFINLKELRFLNLSNNQLNIFPEAITKLKWLKTLQISGNNIEKLPDSINNLKSLRVLELNNNNIVDLPKSIEDLSSLEYLWLEDNQIQILPESIYNLPSLKLIKLRNNPLINSSKIRRRFLDLGVEFKG